MSNILTLATASSMELHELPEKNGKKVWQRIIHNHSVWPQCKRCPTLTLQYDDEEGIWNDVLANRKGINGMAYGAVLR